MVGPIRSLEDLAREGFDLNVKRPCGKYERTIPTAEVRAMFRARKRPEDWQDAPKRWRCSWCGSRVARVKLAAYPAAPPEALAVIRQAALPGRDPQPSRQEVQDALLALPANAPLADIKGFWRAYIEDDKIPAGRASSLQSHLTAIERALGRHHDDAPQMIERKFGAGYRASMDLADLSDAELLERWDAQEWTDEDGSAEQDELAAELERHGLDV